VSGTICRRFHQAKMHSDMDLAQEHGTREAIGVAQRKKPGTW